MSYYESLSQYINDLASRKPAPGGGSASALVGALSASLICMVANFTVGKEEFKNVEEKVKEILSYAEELKEKLLRLVDADVESYLNYSRIKKLPANTLQEKEVKKIKLQEALISATKIPLEIMECGIKLLKLNEELVDKSNPLLISDLSISVEFALLSINSARENVYINIPYIKDKDFVQKSSRKVQEICLLSSQLAEKIRKKIQARRKKREK